jgi:nicotinate-nucleotide pyrophosphorylase (carboxylating)
MKLNPIIVDEIIKNALKEDINFIDLATDLLIPEDHKSIAIFTAKANGVLCGIDVAIRTFKLLDNDFEIERIFEDGHKLKKGEDFLIIKGNTANLLKAERTALNLMQRMSGIATSACEYQRAVYGTRARVADTRKTTPGLRILEKYSVLMGGAYNHRFNLSDAVMIKDNHIIAVGSISNAVKMARDKISHTIKIEVEVKNLAELKEALDVKADIIMLDNMSIEEMAMAVEIADRKAILEASGGITINNILDVAKTGVDVISVGAITHSLKSLDISMNLKQV